MEITSHVTSVHIVHNSVDATGAGICAIWELVGGYDAGARGALGGKGEGEEEEEEEEGGMHGVLKGGWGGGWGFDDRTKKGVSEGKGPRKSSTSQN